MTPKQDDGIEMVSFRIPSALKAAVDAAADARAETATAVLRTALEEHLGGDRRRVFELPGFTAAFAAFLGEREGKRGKHHVALMVQGRDGVGYVYDGTIAFDHSVDGVVAIRKDNKTYVIPRAFIVGWRGGEATEVNHTVTALTSIGWKVVTPGYL